MLSPRVLTTSRYRGAASLSQSEAESKKGMSVRSNKQKQSTSKTDKAPTQKDREKADKDGFLSGHLATTVFAAVLALMLGTGNRFAGLDFTESLFPWKFLHI
jgi:hypothetical protein